MRTEQLGDVVFTAVAENSSGINGESRVEGGLAVEVASPTAQDRGGATNPEELLALSWATCLNAAARVVAGPGVEVFARTHVSLHRRADGEGFEFSARAELRFDGKAAEEAEALAAAAHERCPVSRMLSGRSPVSVVAIP
ncbi:OsmC family protein [Leucobacter sp. GX0328]